jgi:hypothetical protein
MKGRLIQTGRTEEFNNQINTRQFAQGNIQKEKEVYTGPVK